jgi:A/G-specific adenine glycosylase
MLQQTQVAIVIPYFERFLGRFPSVTALAEADLDSVLALWSGLGYYSRARNLHRAARTLVERFQGVFPEDPQVLATLPGVGRSTAGAIAALAFAVPTPILDANVRRVLRRAFGVEGDPKAAATVRALWALAQDLVPARKVRAYTQGMMDLGATLCLPGAPHCERCPVASDCVAFERGQWELPPARPRRARAERSTVMLVLQHGERVLLEKRPPTGIWGGLWCFPETTVDADPHAVCARRFGAHELTLHMLRPLVHDFTHLRLRIQPLRMTVGRLRPQACEPGVAWLALEAARTAGVPAPVKRLLEAA